MLRKKLLNVTAIVLRLDSLYVYIYVFDLFMRVCFKDDNRSNQSQFFRVVFVFFKVVLVVV